MDLPSSLDIKCQTRKSCHNVTINGSNNGSINIYCTERKSCIAVNVDIKNMSMLNVCCDTDFASKDLDTYTFDVTAVMFMRQEIMH